MSARNVGWFQVISYGNGITAIGEDIGSEDVKSFLIEGSQDVAVLDTGTGVGDFAGLVARTSPRDPIVLHSHAHWDHIGASHGFDRVLIHPSEADALRSGEPNEGYRTLFGTGKMRIDRLPEGFDHESAFIPGTDPTGWIIAGDRFDLGGRVLEAFETPGHSPGGITLLDHATRTLFPGDAINLGAIYLYGPDSDVRVYRDTLRLLAELADRATVLRPSHGPQMTAPDVHEIQRAYDEVWAGRAPDVRQPDSYDVYDFGRFSFLIDPNTIRLSERGEVTTG